MTVTVTVSVFRRGLGYQHDTDSERLTPRTGFWETRYDAVGVLHPAGVRPGGNHPIEEGASSGAVNPLGIKGECIGPGFERS